MAVIQLSWDNQKSTAELESPTIQQLKKLIVDCFSELPSKYTLSYLDESEDEIELRTDSDLRDMLNMKTKVYDESHIVELKVQRSELMIEQNPPQSEDKPENQSALHPVSYPIVSEQTLAINSNLSPLKKEQIPTKQKSQSCKKSGLSCERPTEGSLRSEKSGVALQQKAKDLSKSIQQDLKIHEVPCNRCNDDFGIRGIRYQCIICDRFNLCRDCEYKTMDEPHEHPLLKVYRPGSAFTKQFLIDKLLKENRQNGPENVLKIETSKMVQAAREAFDLGVANSWKIMDEILMKLQVGEIEPIQREEQPIVKPNINHVFIGKQVQFPQWKPEHVVSKAKYLQSILGISHTQAKRFSQLYPKLSSEDLLEKYLQIKNA